MMNKLIVILLVVVIINQINGFHYKSLSKLNKFNYKSSKIILNINTENNQQININESTINTIPSINKLLLRSSWISWWIQVILSVISGTILTYANTVRLNNVSNSLWISGFSFSTIGVILSFINTFWTWNITRLSRRIQLNKIAIDKIIITIKKYSKISVVISLIGMLITLIGAEQIVGNLTSKILSTQAFLPSVSYLNNSLQPLDIFLVQANTNTLLAHYSSLLCYLWIQTQLPKQVSFNNSNSNSTSEILSSNSN